MARPNLGELKEQAVIVGKDALTKVVENAADPEVRRKVSKGVKEAVTVHAWDAQPPLREALKRSLSEGVGSVLGGKESPLKVFEKLLYERLAALLLGKVGSKLEAKGIDSHHELAKDIVTFLITLLEGGNLLLMVFQFDQWWRTHEKEIDEFSNKMSLRSIFGSATNFKSAIRDSLGKVYNSLITFSKTLPPFSPSSEEAQIVTEPADKVEVIPAALDLDDDLPGEAIASRFTEPVVAGDSSVEQLSGSVQPERKQGLIDKAASRLIALPSGARSLFDEARSSFSGLLNEIKESSVFFNRENAIARKDGEGRLSALGTALKSLSQRANDISTSHNNELSLEKRQDNERLLEEFLNDFAYTFDRLFAFDELEDKHKFLTFLIKLSSTKTTTSLILEINSIFRRESTSILNFLKQLGIEITAQELVDKTTALAMLAEDPRFKAIKKQSREFVLQETKFVREDTALLLQTVDEKVALDMIKANSQKLYSGEIKISQIVLEYVQKVSAQNLYFASSDLRADFRSEFASLFDHFQKIYSERFNFDATSAMMEVFKLLAAINLEPSFISEIKTKVAELLASGTFSREKLIEIIQKAKGVEKPKSKLAQRLGVALGVSAGVSIAAGFGVAAPVVAILARPTVDSLGVIRDVRKGRHAALSKALGRSPEGKISKAVSTATGQEMMRDAESRQLEGMFDYKARERDLETAVYSKMNINEAIYQDPAQFKARLEELRQSDEGQLVIEDLAVQFAVLARHCPDLNQLPWQFLELLLPPLDQVALSVSTLKTFELSIKARRAEIAKQAKEYEKWGAAIALGWTEFRRKLIKSLLWAGVGGTAFEQLKDVASPVAEIVTAGAEKVLDKISLKEFLDIIKSVLANGFGLSDNVLNLLKDTTMRGSLAQGNYAHQDPYRVTQMIRGLQMQAEPNEELIAELRALMPKDEAGGISAFYQRLSELDAKLPEWMQNYFGSRQVDVLSDGDLANAAEYFGSNENPSQEIADIAAELGADSDGNIEVANSFVARVCVSAVLDALALKTLSTVIKGVRNKKPDKNAPSIYAKARGNLRKIFIKPESRFKT